MNKFLRRGGFNVLASLIMLGVLMIKWNVELAFLVIVNILMAIWFSVSYNGEDQK